MHKKRLFGNRQYLQDNELSTAAFAPMVDLFTILVVAILRASSPGVMIQYPEENFRLPISSQEITPSPATIIDIGQKGIYVDGSRVTDTSYWQNNQDVLISPLYQILQQVAGKNAQIRADAKTSWSIVDKTLMTVQQAGYKDIELLALSNVSL